MTFKEKVSMLEDKIRDTYQTGVTIEEADNYAAEFIHAQLSTSSELRRADLDARMRKSGLKAIRSAVYSESCRGVERKPTEGQLDAAINSNKDVIAEQVALDEAEVEVAELQRLYNIFREAHIYFRGIAKGRFE